MTVKAPGWVRWTGVLLRGLHLVAVVLLGAGMLGAAVALDAVVPAVVLTGIALFAIDLCNKPGYLREASGVSMLIKLALVGWMAADVAVRPILFWVIIVGSAVFAHAPASFRHTVLFGPSRR